MMGAIAGGAQYIRLWFIIQLSTFQKKSHPHVESGKKRGPMLHLLGGYLLRNFEL